MFSFNNSDIAILAALCVANIFCAGVVHRAVLLNAGFIQRRLLFEGLSLIGFAAAIALSLFSVLMWVRNPPFVLACSLVWVTLCLFTVARIWVQHRNRFDKKVLEIPELRDQRPIHSDQQAIEADNKKRWSPATYTMKLEVAATAPEHTIHGAAVPDESETAAIPDQAESGGNEVRGKLEKYNRKRAHRSASVSNLSVYRERLKNVTSEPTVKTACK